MLHKKRSRKVTNVQESILKRCMALLLLKGNGIYIYIVQREYNIYVYQLCNSGTTYIVLHIYIYIINNEFSTLLVKNTTDIHAFLRAS